MLKDRIINLHSGPLPEYRGGSPLNWQMIHGKDKIGLSVIFMDEGIDTGPILAEDWINVSHNDTASTLVPKANECFATMVCGVLEDISKGTLSPHIQDESKAAYWHQRNDDDGQILWDQMTAKDNIYSSRPNENMPLNPTHLISNDCFQVEDFRPAYKPEADPWGSQFW